MAEDIGALVVRIEANMKNFENATEQMNKKISGMGDTIKKVGGLIAGAFAVKGIVNGIKDITEAAMAQVKAENRLQTLAMNVPGTTQAQIDSLKKLAAAQQNLTTIGDEVTIAGQSQLATFQLSTENIAKLTPAFQDLAVATYGANVSQEQMIQSGNLIGKVMQGQVGALSRVGVSFTKAQEEILKTGTESEKTAALIEVLGANFGGLAESTRKTTEGSIIAMNNAWGDMKEVLGNFLLPVLGDVATWFSSKIPAIQETLTNAFGKMRDAISFFIDGFKGEGDPEALLGGWEYYVYKLGEAIRFVKDNADLLIFAVTALTGAILAQNIINGVTKLYKAWQLATASQTTAKWLLNAAMRANPFGLVAAAIGGLIAAGIALWKNWDTIKAKTVEIWESIKTTVTNAANAVWDFLKQWVPLILAAVTGPIGLLVYAIVRNWDTIKAKTTEIWNKVKDFVVNAFKWLYDHNYYFQNLVDNIRKAWDTLKKMTEQVWNSLKAWLQSIWQGISNTSSTIWNGIASFISDIWDRILSTLQGTWNSIASAVSNIWGKISGTISNIAQDIWDTLSGLASRAYEWGSNLLESFIDGIKSKVGMIGETLGGAAEKIKDFLGFHSPTKEGPGAEADKWAPNLVKMYAEGIRAGIPDIRAAVAEAAGSLGSLQANVSTNAIPAPAATTGQTPNFEGMFSGAIFNVRSDNDAKLIAREIFNLQTARSRASGVVYGT